MFIHMEIDEDDVLSRILGELSRERLTALAEETLGDGNIPDGWFHKDDVDQIALSLDDPALLLGVITELRKRGYTVEPGGQP